ncbi:MAG: hypothetical protein K2P94_13400 [Rhodospirillaceae bacterium]|nr:hypothetical protein [Rhodospirillaceae bacterium]
MKKAGAGLTVVGVMVFGACTGHAQDEGLSAQRTLTQRTAALQQDRAQQAEALKSADARMSALTKRLAPLMRVCLQTGAALQVTDAEDAEKSAATVDAQLREASTAARACKSPDALKAARGALTNAIEQTAAIERLTYTGAVEPEELAGVQRDIPEGLKALAEMSAAWTDMRGGFNGFDARLRAYQHDADDFNARRVVRQGDMAAVPSLRDDAALRSQFAALESSVAKISSTRGPLMECQQADRASGPGALSARIEAARKAAAQSFTSYGAGITQDAARCQTHLEARATTPAEAAVVAEAGGKTPPPAEPPPPKSSPVGPVATEALPRIPGAKEKPPVKRTAKRSAPVVAAAPQGVRVTSMSGFATTEEGSNSFGLGEGQTIAIGAGVETKPSSKVRLGGAAQTIDIGADTRVHLPKPPHRFLMLTNGVVEMNRDAGAVAAAGEPDFDGVETAQGVITHRQGRARISAGPGQTTVEVQEGHVHISGSYVLKLPPLSNGVPAPKLSQKPEQEMDLGPGEGALLLRVGAPETVVAAAPEAAQEEPNIAPPVANEPPLSRPVKPPKAETKISKAPAAALSKKPAKETRLAAAPKTPAKIEVARAAPSGPRLPGFLSVRAPEVATAPITPATPSWDVAEHAAPVADPVAAARAQLAQQRLQEEDQRRVAELQRAELERVERRRTEAEQLRREEQRRAEAMTRDDGVEQASAVYDRTGRPLPRAGGDFTGTWRCRITPLQRGRSGAMQSQIVIRTAARGYEAVADGQRIPSVSVQGSRIHFAPSVASRDGRYYGGGIDLDLGDGGDTLEGSGRVRTTDGRTIQEMPASLSCYRLR